MYIVPINVSMTNNYNNRRNNGKNISFTDNFSYAIGKINATLNSKDFTIAQKKLALIKESFSQKKRTY